MKNMAQDTAPHHPEPVRGQDGRRDLDGKIKKSAGVEAGCEDGRLIFTVKKKAAARRKTAAPKAVAKV